MLHRLLKNAAPYHFLRMDGCARLPLMWPINIFSGIFAIPQPRSNTTYACTPFLISFPHVAFETVPMLIRDSCQLLLFSLCSSPPSVWWCECLKFNTKNLPQHKPFEMVVLQSSLSIHSFPF